MVSGRVIPHANCAAHAPVIIKQDYIDETFNDVRRLHFARMLVWPNIGTALVNDEHLMQAITGLLCAHRRIRLLGFCDES